MDLSKKERLVLFNQYEILKRLNPEEASDYDAKQDIVFNGYKYDYDSLIENFEDDMPEYISQIVIDVLQMYRCISNSYYDLSEEEKEAYKKLNTTFQGFDGNEETDYYMYACFLLEKQHLFPESYQDGKIETNSHWNKLEEYKIMLEKWEKVRASKYDSLSLEDIKYIVE